MKVFLVICSVVLLIELVIGWRGHQRLAELRQIHQTAKTRATELGLVGTRDDLRTGTPTHRIPSRTRKARSRTDAQQLADELIELARRLDYGSDEDEANRRFIAIVARLKRMNSEQWSLVLSGLRDAQGISSELRDEFTTALFSSLSQEMPKEVIHALLDSQEIQNLSEKRKKILLQSVVAWGQDDPAGSAKWIAEKMAPLPRAEQKELQRLLVYGIAKFDPRIALQTVEEMGLQTDLGVTMQVARAAETPDERDAALFALREFLADKELPPLAFQTLAFGTQLDRRSFEEASQWMESAQLTDYELEVATTALWQNINPEESGKWLDWFEERGFPDDKIREQIPILMKNWTNRDFLAAGTWLQNAPDGSVRQEAIRSYAESVFFHDQVAAMEWLELVSDGLKRDATLKKIYDNMPRKSAADRAAAEAFAEEQGIR